ncbi:hypothetical protein O3P69_014871 [Scylla paramamosain]|uniref:Uncharacterized protein n=1 Tax=Scylla paramamosain TaxID=85552 RepID=A0AAW0TYX9_SCYPA
MHPSQCWNVKDDYSSNDNGHQETRDGYDTQGSYYVQLPDGRLQEVTHTVNGDSGFVAQEKEEEEEEEEENKDDDDEDDSDDKHKDSTENDEDKNQKTRIYNSETETMNKRLRITRLKGLTDMSECVGTVQTWLQETGGMV